MPSSRTRFNDFARADEDWQMAVQQSFSLKTGDLANTPRAKGKPGSALRALWEARQLAFRLWQEALAAQ